MLVFHVEQNPLNTRNLGHLEANEICTSLFFLTVESGYAFTFSLETRDAVWDTATVFWGFLPSRILWWRAL